MTESFLVTLTAMVLLAGSPFSAHAGEYKDKDKDKPTNATITKVDANKGEITLKYTDAKGKTVAAATSSDWIRQLLDRN